MPSLTSRRDPTPISTAFLLLIALACLLLSASILTATLAATPSDASPGPGAGPRPDHPGAGNEAHLAHHPEKGAPYTAQGLTSARWETGAIQANWNHRALWEAPVTGSGTRVAIIDTGVDPDHPDLRDRVVAWRDFVNDEPRAYDDTGHGTHVAGIIAAGGHTQLRPDQGYFLTGARGLAPDVELLAAKAMDAEGRGDPHRIAQAIEWALDPDGEEGAHIINLSLGISLPSSGDRTGSDLAEVFPETRSMKKVREAVEKATEQGVVVVVAAGNHEAGEDSRILFPGTMDEVITVGAVDPTGRVATFSNTGRQGEDKPDLVAPGVIISTSPLIEGSQQIARYRGLGGTSMAVPFVTGTIALMMEADPSLRPAPGMEEPAGNTERIRAILQDTAKPHPDYGSTEQGAGLLRVDRALQATGTGETQLRPSLYATPGLLVVGGTWIVYRRRGRHLERDGRGPHGAGRPRPRPPTSRDPRSFAKSSPGDGAPGAQHPQQPTSFPHETPLPMESLQAPRSPRLQPSRTSDPFAPLPGTPARPGALPGTFHDPRPHHSVKPSKTTGAGRTRIRDAERRTRPSPGYRSPGRAARRPMRRHPPAGPTREDPVPSWSLKTRRNPDPAKAPDEDAAPSGPRRGWRELRWDENDRA